MVSGFSASAVLRIARLGINVVITGLLARHLGSAGFGALAASLALVEQMLAAEGYHAVLVDIDGAVAESAAAEIRALGHSAQGCAGDVADEARMAAVMAVTLSTTMLRISAGSPPGAACSAAIPERACTT